MSVDAETNDEYCFDWEIYGDVHYKYTNGSIIDCSFTRVYIDDLDLLAASEADKRAAHRIANQTFTTVLNEVLEQLYPEIMAKRQTEKSSLSFGDKKSRNVEGDVNAEELAEDILYDDEEAMQMKQMGVPVAFGRRQRRLPNSFFDVDDETEIVVEPDNSAVDVVDVTSTDGPKVPEKMKLSVIGEVEGGGGEEDEKDEKDQMENGDEIGGERSKEDRWESYWSANGWYIVWSTWLKQWGEQMEEETRQSTEQSLAGFDIGSLHPSHRRLTDDGLPSNSDSGCEIEQQSWDELFNEHSQLVEKKCRELFECRDSRNKKKGARMRRLKQKLSQAGFAVNNGDRKLVNYGDLNMFVDATWDIRPKLPEDDELILFSRHKPKPKATPAEPSSIASDYVDQIHDESVDFSFDPERDACLVAKNALKLHGNDPEFIKYWYQRFRLFTKLNKGVLMDGEGWFSVTPERIAEHIAERMCRKFGGIIVDAFAGVGGNSIQFALRGAHVIAIDLDPIKLRCAKRNAEVYGVADRISFVCSNFFHVAPTLKADAIFLSPPWGGPSYLETEVFDLTADLKPDGYETFAAAQKISPNIAFFLPRNTSVQQLISLAGPSSRVEIEQSLLNLKLKTLTAYYGDLIHDH